jgi:hypothetical protein
VSDPIPLQTISLLTLRSIYPPRGDHSRYHVTGACDVATQSTARPSARVIASGARRSRSARTGHGIVANTVPVPDGWHQCDDRAGHTLIDHASQRITLPMHWALRREARAAHRRSAHATSASPAFSIGSPLITAVRRAVDFQCSNEQIRRKIRV